MAPTLQMLPDATKSQLCDIRRNKARKPVIEKMRRDRINSSIEQLRMLLEKNFQAHHHSNSKLEKADILEMAVSYLQQQKKLQCNQSELLKENGQDSYYQGYYRCLKETVGFLHTQDQGQTYGERYHCPLLTDSRLLESYKTFFQQGASCQISPCNMKIWRPW
ncbi:hypothetical protein GDO86_012550 [Hymenochirus boettgeri]|uniref:Transcription factor HES-5 n=1 Tax=Hymenochirus boettgeri TaxID=247094 RepID=A0A8T2IVM1_9PIPI|nr:hypothetical protein GDO86_012550 [Hymenochirus boettgeri]